MKCLRRLFQLLTVFVFNGPHTSCLAHPLAAQSVRLDSPEPDSTRRVYARPNHACPRDSAIFLQHLDPLSTWHGTPANL